MKSTLFIFLILLYSCALKKAEPPKPSNSVVRNEKRVKKISLKIKKVPINLGTAKAVQYQLPKKYKVESIKCENIGDIVFEQEAKNIRFFMPIPYKFQEQQSTCHLKLVKIKKKIPFLIAKVVPVDYPTRKLNVAKKHVDLSKENLERWLKEKAKQEEVYSTPHKTIQFQNPFIRPLKSKVTSNFGYKRVFNNKKDSWHSGTDLRAAIGTPIPSANRGIVRFAGELFFNGGTVILDHGMGIYTMYCHLSKVLVQEGEILPQGAIIAKSGNTGRSTGPHLHWGTKVNGHWVDSLSMVDATESFFRLINPKKKTNKL